MSGSRLTTTTARVCRPRIVRISSMRRSNVVTGTPLVMSLGPTEIVTRCGTAAAARRT
jgi:hypothetical protein